jgi:hypothetical protein
MKPDPTPGLRYRTFLVWDKNDPRKRIFLKLHYTFSHGRIVYPKKYRTEYDKGVRALIFRTVEQRGMKVTNIKYIGSWKTDIAEENKDF